MRFIILILFFIFVQGGASVFSQKTFQSVAAGGNWDTGATWGSSCKSCVAGTHYPGPDDHVIIASTGNTVTANSKKTIRGNITVAPFCALTFRGTTDIYSKSIVSNGSLSFIGVSTFPGTGKITTSGNGTITFFNINIQRKEAEVFIDTRIASIAGNVINTNGGTLIFSKNSTASFTVLENQSISGQVTLHGNMTVDKRTFTLTNDAKTDLKGVLYVKTGTFDADGTHGTGIFTLKSDAAGDASIAAMGKGAAITGSVTYERYFDNTKKRWRNIGFPVKDVDYSELSSSFRVVDGKSVAWYDEAVAGDVNKGWNMVSGGTLMNGTAYSAFMYDTKPTTISVRGPLLANTSKSSEPYVFTVTYLDDPRQPASDDGWNFVINPFASPVNWKRDNFGLNIGWIRNNINAAAAIWDSQNFSYRYSNVDWDGMVASGQAFWVQANANSPTLHVYEDAKKNVADPAFYRQGAVASRLLITLKDSLYSDATAIEFNDTATVEFDAEFDAYKMQNGIFNLSSLTKEGLNLAANTLPLETRTSGVKLNITNITPGRYALSFSGVSSFQDVDSIMLIDNFLRTAIRISDNSSHRFAVTENEQSWGRNRFELKFQARNGSGQARAPVAASAAGVSEEILVYPNPVEENGDLRIHINAYSIQRAGKIVIQSVSGMIVKIIAFKRGDAIKSVDMRGISSGTYILSIFDDSGVIVKTKLIVK